jgi:DNA invertase Pin-like site-specific DNA recombinase
MIYGYARVSTIEQNLDMQIAALKKYGCEEIITEKQSGANLDREKLNALIEKLKPNDVVVVYKLDRISRSTHQLLNLAKNFTENNIKFVSINDQIDTTTPMGQFFFTVTSAISQLERDITRQRSSDGIAAAKAKGVKFGRKNGMTLKNKQMCAYAQECITKLKKGDGKSIGAILEEQGIARKTYYRYMEQYRKDNPEIQLEL